MSLFTGPMHYHLNGHKDLTMDKEVLTSIDPDYVYIPLVNGNAPCTPCVQVGDEVNKGDLIGVAGESIYGSELDAPMLHFRMYKNDQIVNPKNNFGNALKNVQ